MEANVADCCSAGCTGQLPQEQIICFLGTGTMEMWLQVQDTRGTDIYLYQHTKKKFPNGLSFWGFVLLVFHKILYYDFFHNLGVN